MTGIWLGFVGTDAGDGAAARRFEDEVLALLPRHGARVHFRGHRTAREPASAPAEFHVLWFPSEEALTAYMADPDRQEIIARHGEVFASKLVVRLDPLDPPVSDGPTASTMH